jgi:protein TonB
MPEFSGLFKYLRDNLKYPRVAVENYTSGTVVLQFVVEKDGSIDNIKILNPVRDGCTEEAIRVVKSMPKWMPGKNHGEPVRVLFNLPVKFTIK